MPKKVTNGRDFMNSEEVPDSRIVLGARPRPRLDDSMELQPPATSIEFAVNDDSD